MRSTSSGTLLGGKVAYTQFTSGYRTGIEPVLLAAAIPAAEGDRVVEAGTGAGAGLLCLAARVPSLCGVGLEIDPALAALAAANLVANGHPPTPSGLCILTQDVVTWRAAEPCDHAFANPPWHAADGTPSPDPSRRRAKIAGATALTDWTRALAASLRRRGTLTLLLPAAAASLGIQALREADCPEIDIMPLWPHQNEPARLVILRGVRLGKGGDRILPGLVMHDRAGSYTPEAEAVFRGGAGMG